MSHYETLGVGKDADEAAIRKAYRKKALAAHPDRAGGVNQAMVAINRAYETLSDLDKRARYDATGEDSPQPSADQKARETVMQVFVQLADQLPEGANLIDATRQQLRNNKMELTAEEGRIKTLVARMERQRKWLKRKAKEGRDFLDDLLAQRLGAATEQLKSFDAAHRQVDAALKLVDEYEWTGAPMVQPTYGQMFTSSWTR